MEKIELGECFSMGSGLGEGRAGKKARARDVQRSAGSLLGSVLAILGLIGCGAATDSPAASQGALASEAGKGDTTASSGVGENDAEPDAAGEGDLPRACEAGTPGSKEIDPNCQVVARGLCFTDARTACACAGCDAADCAIAESFPARAICQESGSGSGPTAGGDTPAGVPDQDASGVSGSSTGTDSDASGAETTTSTCASGSAERDAAGNQSCQYVAGGVCFASADEACACAGCALDACLMLDTFPAQVRCSQ